MKKVIIVGVGSPFGWDRIAIDLVESLSVDVLSQDYPEMSIEVETCTVPAQLPGLFAGAELAIVADALLSPDHPLGTIIRLNPSDLEPGSHYSSHGFDLPQALALAEAAGMGPDKLVLLGVCCQRQEESFEVSEAMSVAIYAKIHKDISLI